MHRMRRNLAPGLREVHLATLGDCAHFVPAGQSHAIIGAQGSGRDVALRGPQQDHPFKRQIGDTARGNTLLWWRKRNEGFEWRDYVRTTILVRREQRRKRLKDVQAAAAAHVKDASRRGLDAGVHGARSAGTGTWSGLK